MALPLTTLFRTLRGVRGTGFLPSLPDDRDDEHAWRGVLGAALPAESLELSRYVQIRNQGGSNSCTAHAVDGAKQALCGTGRGPGGRAYTLRSVASPYWHARVLDGLEAADGGAYLRSALKADAHLGAPPEAAWPLKVRTINAQPPADAYRLGHAWRGLKYGRIPGGSSFVAGVLEALASGLPVVAGFGLDEAFFDHDGPDTILAWQGRVAGHHAMSLCGFTRTLRAPDSVRFRVANSWGTNYRDHGFCWFGPEIIAGATEGWVVRGWS